MIDLLMRGDVAPHFLALILSCAMTLCATPSERRDAIACASVIAIVWLLYVSAWLDHSPVQMIWLTWHVKVSPAALWAATDAVALSIIMGFWAARPRGWLLVLSSLYLAQLAEYAINQNGPFHNYAWFLNSLWYGQLLCLLWVGGELGRNRLFDGGRRFLRNHGFKGATICETSPE